MAILECPTRNDLPSYNYVISLDSVNYMLDFKFNSRMQKWFVSLSDQFANQIVGPVPIIANWPLFDRFVGNSIFPGTLFAFDTSGQTSDPGRYDLGDRVRIFYAGVTP